MGTVTDKYQTAKLAEAVEELNGVTAALVAYVAHLPGADRVRVEEIQSDLKSLGLSTGAKGALSEAALVAVQRIENLAREIAKRQQQQ